MEYLKRTYINTLAMKAMLTLFLIFITLVMKGQFGDPSYLAYDVGWDMQVADFDNDGDLDFINDRGEFIIYENIDTVGQNWKTTTLLNNHYLYLSNYTLGDFNNDGWTDIISSRFDTSFLYLNNADSNGISFTPQTIDISNWTIPDIFNSTRIHGVGKINNDNTLDLLIINPLKTQFSIVENYLAQDSFSIGYTSDSLPDSWKIDRAKLFDVDSDGDLDVLAINKTITSINDTYYKELVWYKNEDGLGAFSDKIVIEVLSSDSTLSLNMRDVEMEDFNGDGLLDLVYIDGNYLKFRYQLSNQDFPVVNQSIWIYDFPFESPILIGDIDNDGDFDVTHPRIEGTEFRWYKNANGIFESVDICCFSDQISSYGASLNSKGQLRDVDGDGDLDIIFTGVNQTYQGVFLMANINDGDSFSEPFKISTNLNSPIDVIPHDLENDGDNDLWIHDKGNGEILIKKNIDGLGKFSALIPVIEDLNIKQIDIYDVDGNGIEDIVGISSDGSNSDFFYYEILDSIPTLSVKHIIYSSIEEFVNFEIKDIDNDELIDIGIGGKEEIYWLRRNEPSGTNFSFLATNIFGSLIGFGDSNGDNLNDLYYYEAGTDSTNYYFNTHSIRLPKNLYPRVAIQSTSGDFNSIILSNQDGYKSFLVSDLNEDGKSELLAGLDTLGHNSKPQNIFLFNHDGVEFQKYEIFSVHNDNINYSNFAFNNFYTEDIDNDGKLDIIWGTNWFKQLSNYLDFSSSFDILNPQNRNDVNVVAVSDLNGNSRKDLVYSTNMLLARDVLFWKENQTDEVYWIEGNIAKDENENCQHDASIDSGLSNWVILLENDSISYFANTSSLGNYATYVLDTGDYIVNAIAPSVYWEPCFSDSTIQVFDSINAAIVNIPIEVLVDCPLLGLSDAATNLRPCIPGKIVYQYCNYGTALAEDAQLEILVDEFLNINSTSIPISMTTDSSLIFDIGNFDIGECGNLELFVTPDCDSTMVGDVLCLQAYITPDFVCETLDSLWDGSTIAVDGFCTNDSITFTIENVGIGDMSMPRDWRVQIVNDEIVMLIIQDTFQLISGQTKTLTIANNQEPLQIEADQDINHPTSSTASIVVGACSELTPMELANLIHNFPDSDGNPFTEHLCITLTGSYDPNIKEAIPLGVSDQNFIDRDWELDYTIHFQNTGNDYAFNVVIVDTISPYLDLSTLRVGAGSHDFDWKLNPDRSITFTFPNIYLPDSTTNNLESQGLVQFFITPKSDLLPSTEIINRASIYFDANEPILTNEVVRKIQIPTYGFSEHLQLCIGEEFLNQIILSDSMMIDTTSNTPLGLYLDFYHLHITPSEISIDTTVQLGDIYNGVVITQDTILEDFYVDDNGCEINVIINVFLPVDIFELDLGKEIHIYPNPTSNQIFIEKEDDRIDINNIEIRNVSGVRLKNFNSHNLSNRKIKIDVNDLLPGVYVIEINTDIGIIFKKLIVVK